MRSGQELRKKTRQKEFLNEIVFHSQKFIEFQRKKLTASKKKAYGVRNYLDTKEKKEQRIKDKEESDRIKALKEKDVEAYIVLVYKQKNERLMHILE